MMAALVSETQGSLTPITAELMMAYILFITEGFTTLGTGFLPVFLMYALGADVFNKGATNYTFVGQEWVDGKWKNHLLYWKPGKPMKEEAIKMMPPKQPYIDVWSPPLPWGPVPPSLMYDEGMVLDLPKREVPTSHGTAPQLSPFSPTQNTSFLRPQLSGSVDWNNVVGAVAREDGLEVTERQADGTIGSVFLPRG